MRVLHVTGCYPPAGEWGGAATAAHGLCRALCQHGLEVEVFTTSQRSRSDLPAIAPGRREVDGVPTTYFRSVHGMGRAFLAPGLAGALWRAVRRFDLVHLHMLWTFPGIAAASICQARRVPYAISLHGALDPWALQQRRLEKKLFLALAERRNLERAAFLHFTQEAERAASPVWIRRLPGVVVPLPVEADQFARLGEPLVRARSREVLLLARIHPMKGFEILIPAMRQVVSREPGARLIVAGPDEGGHLAHVRRLVAESGLGDRVSFSGYLDAPARARALATAAVLVAPSHRENFCLSVAEGMAAGLPVVVSDAVNIGPEVVAAGAGRVVARDPALLAEALLELLAAPELRERMGAAGRRLVLARYAPQAVATSLVQAYQGAIAGRGAAQRVASR